MGKPVLILGPSGSGKTFSLKNFPDDKYSLVEVFKDGLPFKSDKEFIVSDDKRYIQNLIYQSQRKVFVIDDSQYLMANQFMNRISEKGWEKFSDIGFDFWDLVRFVSYDLPADKIVYFMHHIDFDVRGNVKAKTIGKMLDEKITLEGLFTIVLLTVIVDKKHYFITQSDGTSPVKSPFEMFEEEFIPNDLYAVDTQIRNFYNMEAI